ncbi:MAG: membrane protein [Gemmatimonadota bacterium]
MMAFEITAAVAALTCGLVAGFVFAFATVVMPGISTLADRDFLRAFQVVDAVIQRGQPLFGMVWLGSAVAVLLSLFLGVSELAGLERVILITAALTYLAGTQLTTVLINIPLNNELQGVDLEATGAEELRQARMRFEGRWNRWNVARTAVATLVTAAYLLLLARI